MTQIGFALEDAHEALDQFLNDVDRDHDILMPLLRYDAATQARLNTIQQQYGATAIADQEIATNKALAAADAQLAKVLAANPNVLVNECLQIVSTAEKDNFKGLPLALGCIPNSGGNLAVSAGK